MWGEYRGSSTRPRACSHVRKGAQWKEEAGRQRAWGSTSSSLQLTGPEGAEGMPRPWVTGGRKVAGENQLVSPGLLSALAWGMAFASWIKVSSSLSLEGRAVNEKWNVSPRTAGSLLYPSASLVSWQPEQLKWVERVWPGSCNMQTLVLLGLFTVPNSQTSALNSLHCH